MKENMKNRKDVMNEDLYLTDKQYRGLLNKVEDLVEKTNTFQVYDNTDSGNKSTTSTIGLCADDKLTTLEIALFPEDFKDGKTSMKYKKDHHLCPFDTRLHQLEVEVPTNMMNGCYYTCRLQQPVTDKEEMLSLVEQTKTLYDSGKMKTLTKQINDAYFKN